MANMKLQLNKNYLVNLLVIYKILRYLIDLWNGKNENEMLKIDKIIKSTEKAKSILCHEIDKINVINLSEEIDWISEQ